MLLDKPKAEMEAELERLYLKSELGIDERWQQFREFGERGRGPRNGPGPGPFEGGRPGTGPQRRPDGQPFEPRFGPMVRRGSRSTVIGRRETAVCADRDRRIGKAEDRATVRVGHRRMDRRPPPGQQPPPPRKTSSRCS